MRNVRSNSSEKAVAIARMADEQKAENILVLDVSENCNFTDCFVFVTCTSTPMLRAVGRKIERSLRERGERPLHVAGYDTTTWIVQDYGDVVVHLLSPETRRYYELERLWSDGANVDWGTDS